MITRVYLRYRHRTHKCCNLNNVIVKMDFPSPRSSPERSVESPEYMDIQGFEGFFQETKERRTVEFEDFLLSSDDADKGNNKLDVTEDDIDAELAEDSEDEELTLLKAILALKDEVGEGVSRTSSDVAVCF